MKLVPASKRLECFNHSSRQPRRAEPSKLPEPATDSEDEDEEEEEEDDDDDGGDHESSDYLDSSWRRRAVKTGARSRERKSNVHSLGMIKFKQLEEKDKEGAKFVGRASSHTD